MFYFTDEKMGSERVRHWLVRDRARTRQGLVRPVSGAVVWGP